MSAQGSVLVQCSFCPENATGHSPSAHVFGCERHTRQAQRSAVEIIDASPLLASALNDARLSLALQAVRYEQTPTEALWMAALHAAQDIGAEALIPSGPGRIVHTELGAIDAGFALANCARQVALAPQVRARVDPLVDKLVEALRAVEQSRGSIR